MSSRRQISIPLDGRYRQVSLYIYIRIHLFQSASGERGHNLTHKTYLISNDKKNQSALVGTLLSNFFYYLGFVEKSLLSQTSKAYTEYTQPFNIIITIKYDHWYRLYGKKREKNIQKWQQKQT